METEKTNENALGDTICWICRRNRNELRKTTQEYWDREDIDESLRIEIIKNGAYLDVGFEPIKIRKEHSKETMEIWVCAVCVKLIRTIFKNMLKGIKTD
jgi:hypothetical protein